MFWKLLQMTWGYYWSTALSQKHWNNEKWNRKQNQYSLEVTVMVRSLWSQSWRGKARTREASDRKMGRHEKWGQRRAKGRGRGGKSKMTLTSVIAGGHGPLGKRGAHAGKLHIPPARLHHVWAAVDEPLWVDQEEQIQRLQSRSRAQVCSRDAAVSAAALRPSHHSLWYETRERTAQVTWPQRHQGMLTLILGC